jgi:putative phosphoribosyl transferase
MQDKEVTIDVGQVSLDGELVVPDAPRGVVVFAHGSGSGRKSPRNQYVAAQLRGAGIATLLMDLLTVQEEEEDRVKRHLRFDIGLLAGRLVQASRWLLGTPELLRLPVGYYGASTGAAAALIAAAEDADRVAAVVSRGGRPDLAGRYLPRVIAPTLLMVGSRDREVQLLNEEAMMLLGGPAKLVLVPGAGHLFEEPGTLERVAAHTLEWFLEYLRPRPTTAATAGAAGR